MNSKKQLKSKVFYEDGHVHNVRWISVNEGSTHCYVKADVLPSMPTSNKKDSPDYYVWDMLSKVSGCVNSAECNCTAGEGEACNHIAALLYAVADIAQKKKDGKLATTSQKCKWNNPRKRKLSPKKAEDLSFRKYNFGKTTFSRTKISLISETDSTVNITRFHERLLKNKSKAGWLTNFVKTESVKVPDLPCLHSEIIFQFSNKVNLRSKFCRDLFTNYFEKFKIREEDCIQMEILTREQSNSVNWHKAREDRITASNFGKVAKRKAKTQPEPLLKYLRGYTSFDNEYIHYGRPHETVARKTYTKQMQHFHPGLQVKVCGLLVDSRYPHVGASPDAQ